MVTRVIESPGEAVGAQMPDEGTAQAPTAPIVPARGQFSDTRFDKLQAGRAPAQTGIARNPSRLQEGNPPGEPGNRSGGPAPGGRRGEPLRRAGGQGGSPPRKPPPTGRQPGGADDANEPGDSGALSWQAQLTQLSQRITESPQLDLFAICDILDKLGGLAAQSSPKRPKAFGRQDFVPSINANIAAALDELIHLHLHSDGHPRFDGEQSIEIAWQLEHLRRYPAAVTGMLALMEYVDPVEGLPIGRHENDDFLTLAFDVLRYQPSNKDTEQLCHLLAPYVGQQCPRYEASTAAILLFHHALPALEHQLDCPGGRALLQALTPYVRRFFDEAVRSYSYSANIVEGFDVLSALRGVQNLSVTPDDALLPMLEELLTSIDSAVTARLLGMQHATRTMYARFSGDKIKQQPRGERVLADLIYSLRNHFTLESARHLVASVYQWLDIKPERIPLDAGQLVNDAYRDDALKRLLTAKPDSPP